MNRGDSSTPRILAIDDDPVSLAVATVLLEAQGWDVLVASSGEDALALLVASAEPALPDCILADLRMPSLAGPELAVHLRRAAPHAWIFAMSASPPPHVDGYHGVLGKPLSPEALQVVFAAVSAASAPLVEPPESPASSDAEESDFIDAPVFERLREAMSDAALLEVLSAFLHDTELRILSMRSADPDTVRREAHTVKGGASMVGARLVSLTAACIEAGIDHPGERLRKLDEMERCLHRTEVILKRRLTA